MKLLTGSEKRDKCPDIERQDVIKMCCREVYISIDAGLR
jgi:hypothetical protein